jgi:hypothetical protein
MRVSHLVALAAVVAMVPMSAAAGAVTPLPGQVNNDASAGIDPTRAALSEDLAFGSLSSTGTPSPWATFAQSTTGADQVFVRAFGNGTWHTVGSPAALNVNTAHDASSPAIGFAGTGRTSPWVSWSENQGTVEGVFARRFDTSTGAGGGSWTLAGQDRDPGTGVSTMLNIHPARSAGDPAIAGGATTAGTALRPWVAWDENDGETSDNDLHRNIFVARALGPSLSDCPVGTKPSGGTPAGGVCWQQVGADRLSSSSDVSSGSGDPSLNVDPTRAGLDPSITFTGLDDTVPWVVWYEAGTSTLTGFRSNENEQVFAAKGVADSGTGVDGGFHWQAVGSGTAGLSDTLDTSGPNGWGNCAASQANDDACALNADATHDAEQPQVAAGTMTPGSPTVPWVTWQENANGVNQIFAARLVAGSFELTNLGAPLSDIHSDATHPSITFVGNTPYVAWHELLDTGADALFVGHFTGTASAPTFHLDTPSGVLAASPGVRNQRSPLASACAPDPQNSDGAACQGGLLGTPLMLAIANTATQPLLAAGYAADAVTTTAAHPSVTRATAGGTVNPGGAAVHAGCQYGRTTSYGHTVSRLEPAGSATVPFKCRLRKLSPGTKYHYRAFASTDFTTVTGADRTLRTARARTALSSNPSRHLTKGAKLRVSTTLTDTSRKQRVAHAKVTLWRRPIKGGHWARVASRRTNRHGKAHTSLRVSRSVRLQWRYAGDHARRPAVSHVEKVTAG